MSPDPADAALFRRLFDAHLDDLWRFARRRCASAADADDIAAQVFDDPGAVETLSLWVADDLVHQIEIADADRVVRTRLSDFGAEIAITAPPGPYVPADDN